MIKKFFKISFPLLFSLFAVNPYLNAYENFKNGCLEENSENYKNGQYGFPFKYEFYLVNKKGKEQYCDFLFSFVDLENNREKLDFTKIGCTSGAKIEFLGQKTVDPFLTPKLNFIFNDGAKYTVSAIDNNQIYSPKIECFPNAEKVSNKVLYNFDNFDEKFHLRYSIRKNIYFKKD